ncbi:MAG: type II secretion system GspH family protein [Saccharofermentans sp.]|nr:type II secretion system GspH family protein [Saccharofermentans sp.]
MKKVQKSKRGFTLIEMVLVIAIIVILAGVLSIGISGYLERATNAAASVSVHNSLIESATQVIQA